MTYIQAFFLGIIQGIGEFLPISSSGHLFIAKYFFNIDDVPLLFDVALHLATLASILIVLRKEILSILYAGIRWIKKTNTEEDSSSISMLFIIIIATLITLLLGYFINEISSSIVGVAIGFLYTSVLLISTKFLQKLKPSNSLAKACLLGFFQAIAVFPGVSRSGSTIFAGLLGGIKKENAAQFSFIMSIPVILAAFIYSLKDIKELMSNIELGPLFLAIITSFVTGIFTLQFLITLVKKTQLYKFSFYLIPLAIYILINQ